jgi:streptomycin 6-kinase
MDGMVGLRESALIESYLDGWRLEKDGEPFSTASSLLAPVRRDGLPLMVKIATSPEERLGNQFMLYWRGNAVADVLEHDSAAVLVARAEGPRSLTAMAEAGDEHDDDATEVLCLTAQRLHADGGPVPTGTIELDAWFSGLFAHADGVGGIYERAAGTARVLLDDSTERVPLHGDLHHGNVLDFGAGGGGDGSALDGWLAIDPKGLVGDPAFEYATILCNPTPEVATRPGRFVRQLEVIARCTGISPELLTRWTFAMSGLAAAWIAQDDLEPGHWLEVGSQAEWLLLSGRV